MGTKNMWLYSNWGRALEKVGKKNKAIEVYKKAIALPLKEYIQTLSLQSSNRAIPLIFRQLISLLRGSKDWEEVDNTHQKRLEVFNDGCSYASYANFRLKQFGDFDKAITLSEKTLIKKTCKQFARETLASAYLLKIAKSKNLTNEENTSIYNKSIILMTNPIEMITDLASSKHTFPAIEILNKQGTSINSKDTRNYTPLAYAIHRGDEFSANALIKKGVELDSLVSEENLTYLMLAVAYNRESLVKLLLKKGVDTTIMSEDGHTASSIAKALNLNKIQKILSAPKGV